MRDEVFPVKSQTQTSPQNGYILRQSQEAQIFNFDNNNTVHKTINATFQLLTSSDLSPQVKWRCEGFAAFESHPRYSCKLVDVYTHREIF